MSVVRTLFGEEDDHQAAETHVNGMHNNPWRIGRVAEFLVCAELTRLGYYVLHVDSPGFDLILAVDDASLRVQVRSSTRIADGFCTWTLATHANMKDGKRRGPGMTRPITKAQADLLALYHHEFGTMIFLPVEGRKYARLPVSQVKHHVASESLAVALKRLGITKSSAVVNELPH